MFNTYAEWDFWRTYTTIPHLHWVASGSTACEILFSGTTDGNLAINALISSLSLQCNGGSQMCWMLCFKDMQQCRALCFVAARGQQNLLLRQTLMTAQGPAGPRPRGNSQHATLHSWCGMIPFPFGSRLHFFTPTQKNWKSTAKRFRCKH